MRDLAALMLTAALLAPLTAQAAGALAGPDALPGQATGVVGSGDQMTLRLKPIGDAPARVLKIGDEFEDGWKLTALTASAATLSKAGASRTVGLNPAGSLGAAALAAGASTVTVVTGPRTNAAQADQSVQTATATLQQARAALAAATPDTAPDTRQALQIAVNRATIDQVKAMNDQIRAVEILNGADPASFAAQDAANQAENDARAAALAAQNAALRAARAGR